MAIYVMRISGPDDWRVRAGTFDPVMLPYLFYRPDGLYSDFDVLDLSRTRELGKAPSVEIEIRNPGLSALFADSTTWLLIWEGTFGDETTAPRILAVARTTGLPSELSSGTVKLEAECRKDDWQAEAIALYRNSTWWGSLGMDRLFYDQAEGPKLADYAEATVFLPHIDPVTLEVSLVADVAWVDVVPGRAAGSFQSAAGYVRDLTGLALDDLVIQSDQPPLATIRTRLQVAWTQQAQGVCDLSTSLTPWRMTQALGGFQTYTPDELVSSIPATGASLGAGWTVVVSNFGVATTQVEFDRPLTEAAISSMVAGGWSVVDDAKVLVERGSVYARSGTYAGLAAAYDYSQRRQESILIQSSADLQPLGITAASGAETVGTNLADPTADPETIAWAPETDYEDIDVRSYGGVTYSCVVAHRSTDEFDSSKWEEIESPSRSLDPREPSYMTTDRGGWSQVHAAMRNAAVLVRRAQPLVAKFTVPWGVGIGIADGDLVRIRDPEQLGENGEIIGVVKRATAKVNGDSGASSVAIEVKIAIGRGIDQADGVNVIDGIQLQEAAYKTVPEPIYASLLSSEFYAVLDVNVSGQNAAAQSTAIQNAITSANGVGVEAAVKNALSAAGNKLSITMRPLTQEDCLSVQHGTRSSVKLAIPRGIVLS
jgi:hypothetical protein